MKFDVIHVLFGERANLGKRGAAISTLKVPYFTTDSFDSPIHAVSQRPIRTYPTRDVTEGWTVRWLINVTPGGKIGHP